MNYESFRPRRFERKRLDRQSVHHVGVDQKNVCHVPAVRVPLFDMVAFVSIPVENSPYFRLKKYSSRSWPTVE